ncbi:MAG TPA: protein-methionine-sulfoxide reductase heme-binding subunit MsrQ [Burkholderiaceae bacterium]|nr:protein-methionine-sulfoxide reductase heme-binding subunit MsrQ [Burkholderiaceae bacterium]
MTPGRAAADSPSAPAAAGSRARPAPRRPGRLLWWLIFLACLLPLARLVVLGVQGGLGANPVEFVTRSTGTWTLVLLCSTLALTPLRRLAGWSQAIRYRRMLGLYTFFYGCLHFTTYVWLDQWFEWSEIVRDVLKRPFITVGFAAFVLMLPLALTSSQAAMRRLGRRWQALHRLIYAVAVLAILHYWWHKAGKNDLGEPMIYGAVVALLLGLRIAWRMGAPTVQRGSRRSSA